MRPVSERFNEACRYPNRAIATARVLNRADEPLIPILDGSVTLDAQADSRGRMDLTVPATFVNDAGEVVSLNPDKGTDLLAPYGNEIHIARGVRYEDGTDELIPLGVFRIETAEIDDSGPELRVVLSGVDRSVRYTEFTFEAGFTVPAGTNVVNYIAFCAEALFPGAPRRFLSSSKTTALAFNVNEGDSIWELMQVLAGLMLDAGLWFDGDGTLVLAPLPTGLSQPVLTFEEGPGGALLGARRSMNRDQAINRTTVVSQSVFDENVIFRGEATDTDPASPTYYGGPFGRKTYTYADNYGLLRSNAECQASADSLLALHKGIAQQVTFDALVNPAVEPFDVVRVHRERLGVNANFILDSVSIPLSGGRMSASTRQVQVVNA